MEKDLTVKQLLSILKFLLTYKVKPVLIFLQAKSRNVALALSNIYECRKVKFQRMLHQ